MMPEIFVIPDEAIIYLIFSKEEILDNNKYILHRSEAVKLIKDLRNKIKRVPKRISKNGGLKNGTL